MVLVSLVFTGICTGAPVAMPPKIRLGIGESSCLVGIL